MTIKIRDEFKGLDLIRQNNKKINELKKSKLKIDKLAAYMLGGRPVTGAIMVARFHIYSYRDAIYDLKKKGYEISRKDVRKGNTTHTIWWISDFPEEFVMRREEKLW